jgi:acylphosphatase
MEEGASAATTTLRLHILGRVQGVGYRWWAAQTARALGLTGWVRNLTDGSVEALAHGPKDAVDRFVGECHAGPPSARVTAVNTAHAEKFSGMDFQQRPTAPAED